METGSEEEINSLSWAISTKHGEQLEIIKQIEETKANIYVSEEITIENVTTIIKAQNPEITLNGEDVAKFRYKNRKGTYNIVIEVGLQTQKQIFQTKLKIVWEICNVEDYLVPTRCYMCS